VCVCVCVCHVLRCHTVARIRLKLCGNNLRVTESCMGYLVFMCALPCAYYWTDSLQNWWRHYLGHRNVHGIIDFTCTLACASYAHVCVRTFLDVFAQKFVKTSLCMCYILLTCALACVHYARTMHVRALHACARSHIIGRILSTIDGNIPWIT
jgi:hypothetical protein